VIGGQIRVVRDCARCGSHLRGEARFCSSWGLTIADDAPVATTLQAVETGRKRHLTLLTIGLTSLAIAPIAAIVALTSLGNERNSRRHADKVINAQLTVQARQLNALQTENDSLAIRLAAAQLSLKQSKAGNAPLAARILKSVFTVETSYGLGTAWAAWSANEKTYLITAYHVVSDALAAGETTVTLHRKGSTWHGHIGAIDETNDIAVITVSGRVANPLWQIPDDTLSPLPGDQLLLVGSPYGLEGTVTTGVVSRMSYDEIQTDAAANPGNSGGPAVDKQGRIVGILLSGGGENLNFLVPIQRACVTVRTC
jgi:putative serine protease PepD